MAFEDPSIIVLETILKIVGHFGALLLPIKLTRPSQNMMNNKLLYDIKFYTFTNHKKIVVFNEKRRIYFIVTFLLSLIKVQKL